jgi:tetratricopeptide (TPR) repeat protein
MQTVSRFWQYTRILAGVGTLVVGCTFALKADVDGDADLQFQLASLLYDEARFSEAFVAFTAAAETGDQGLAIRARKGTVRSSLRVAEFDRALAESEQLRALAPSDTEGLTLHADALWSMGSFDDADREYREGLEATPGSARARFGVARSLAAVNRLDLALDTALAASAASPRDGEIHALVGSIYERLNRYDQAANAFRNYINLLPNRDRSEKAAWARAQVEFLESFEKRRPLDIDQEDLDTLHTMPFTLAQDKIVVKARVNGGRLQDFVLDTGSEETVLSQGTARRYNVRPVSYTLSAGVGDIGLRGLQLSRIDSLELGTLQVRNVPVLVKNPALRDVPRREADSFSPLSLGMSMRIDYENQLLTIGRTLPPVDADIRLPMRIDRLAMVRGLLNSSRPIYFVVDTGGEVISISAATASTLPTTSVRRVPLRVWGTSGWDPDAFLMPGVDLEFDAIQYRNYSMVVLNLRAPSILLGFQLGGIVGHTFLAPFRVTMDLERSELSLERF